MHGYRSRLTPFRAVFAFVSLVLFSDPCTAQEDDVTTTARAVTTPIRLGETPAEQRIREVLNEPTTLDVRETPLRDVLAYIEKQYHLEIELDRFALEESQITLDTPVTKEFINVSLQYALSSILDELDLEFAIESDVILVSAYDSEEPLFWVVYPVGDLLSPPKNGKLRHDELKQVLVAIVDPSSWDDVGGPAQLLGFRNLLIIQQTDDAHHDIESLFKALRSVGETVMQR